MSKLQRLSYLAIDQIAQKELLAYLGSQDKVKAAEPVNIWHYAEIYKGYGMEYAAVSADHKTLALSVFDDSAIEGWHLTARSAAAAMMVHQASTMSGGY